MTTTSDYFRANTPGRLLPGTGLHAVTVSTDPHTQIHVHIGIIYTYTHTERYTNNSMHMHKSGGGAASEHGARLLLILIYGATKCGEVVDGHPQCIYAYLLYCSIYTPS